jgi:hypothetical protein
MQKRYEDVVLFCPEVKTGGPEALHQLAYQINRHGGSAHLAYYAPVSHVEIEGNRLRCRAENSPMPAQYAQYHPHVLREISPGPDTLLVFPETLCHLAAVAAVPYQRALWWLSVDNAPAPILQDAAYQQPFFGDPGLHHFYQSDYARAFLQKACATACHPLSDYTDQDFVHLSLIASANPPIRERPNRICFFPNKGAERAASFIEAASQLRHNVEFVPIRGMSKPQVRDCLFSARLYIDFGNQPGKDRVPREAAIAGAILLLHAAGAGAHYLDHPLPRTYLFGEADIVSGRLHALVNEILDAPETHWEQQRFYRDAILREQEKFDLETRTLFFTGF